MAFVNRIIYFIYFIIIIKSSKSTFSLIYPYFIPLSDGNFLVIHKYGISICICNSLSIEIINNITSFTNDEEISTEASLSKITSESENGYIFCIIIDKIYIFNENGNLLSQLMILFY